jgi:indolepyruvate ferredoxin oxidoreductase
MLDVLLEKLGPRNLEIAVEIASLPEHVRGFEQVREEHIAQTRAKQVELLAAFRLHSEALRA